MKREVEQPKMPKCCEVCDACKSGEHVFHIMGQLANLFGTRTKNGKIDIQGSAEDELFLEEMMGYWPTWRR